METSLADLQPSQIFINEAKLESINTRIQEEGVESLDSVPIKQLGDHLILTDGHTRAFALHQLGHRSIKSEWDDSEMDWMLYRLCVHWALARDITHIADLEPYIISDIDYPKIWIRSCHKAGKRLDELFPNRSYYDIIDYSQYDTLQIDYILNS